ncbi:hypothetical protein BU14_1334s0004 [Porphyra umbilicalis]|uniref:Uncharacterized protein n=1 Tax=Porphyra umbilicalis TaxID=2786 RepID=A0A1X6NM11_PORUM|nr:hypothetical protein BU14_1334s0004 [Porphyra umbilicalis]|eukprot:OSX69627.1 hypothetical protein BU14_1334s0004 [Porphyra umbilicalis]
MRADDAAPHQMPPGTPPPCGAPPPWGHPYPLYGAPTNRRRSRSGGGTKSGGAGSRRGSTDQPVHPGARESGRGLSPGCTAPGRPVTRDPRRRRLGRLSPLYVAQRRCSQCNGGAVGGIRS